jgi:hypothetical protein
MAAFPKSTRILLLFLLFCYSTNVSAQWSIPSPQIGVGSFGITDTVYMSPGGSDSASGTELDPVATFSRALQLLPFGVPGVAGGNRYVLVRLLPGTYYIPSGLSQSVGQWQQGNTFKNVSVEGLGEVDVYGDPGTTSTIHGLRLYGSHIFIRNIRLHNYSGVGLLVNRGGSNPNDPGSEHILIDGVTVDSTGSHGVLLYNSEVVFVRNSRVLRAARLNFETQPISSCTSWPSGLKFYYSKNITVEGTEVAYTRGEGLNFHNCEYTLAEGNRIHDNLTNIYNDNSARVIIRRNYVYNTPGATSYAVPCIQEVGAVGMQARGMLLGNEGACADPSHSPIFQECSSLQCNGLFLTPYQIPTIDSTFIYNNIFHYCGGGIHLWEGSSGIPNPNCVKNTFILHNTFWGLSGSPEAQGSWISLFFPSYNFFLNSYGQVQNLECYGNLFGHSVEDFPLFKTFRGQFNNQGDFTYSFRYNRWVAEGYPVGEGNLVVPAFYQSIPLDSLELLQPTCSSALLQPVPSYGSWLHTDYWGQVRDLGWTNAGAVEADCVSSQTAFAGLQSTILFPNPGQDRLYIVGGRAGWVQVFSSIGVRMYSGEKADRELEIRTTGWPAGNYWIVVGGVSYSWIKLGGY